MRNEFSISRLLIAIGFALACFGLLLFLWVTFGGPTIFGAKSYRLKIDLPQAAGLVKQSDVRIGGVSVGKVEEIGLAPGNAETRVEVEIYPEYAPLPTDTRVIVRQKTLLGETYLELTSGTDEAGMAPDGGQLADARAERQTQIDEIFNALDPRTREAFRIWMRNAAVAVEGRGLALNDALGNLSPFLTEATYVLEALDRQHRPLGRAIRDSGEFFAAVSSRDQGLARAITASNEVFGVLADRELELAETISILPTFEQEARLTLNRLDEFADDAEPLVAALRPVARDLVPTLRSARRLSPDLEALFAQLPPLNEVSRTGLPALAATLGEVRPVVAALDPFVANLAPVLRYMDYYLPNVGDFLAAIGAGFAATLVPRPGDPAPAHVLRIELYTGNEAFGIAEERVATNRGNAYLPPGTIRAGDYLSHGGYNPSFDCDPSGGEVGPEAGQYSGFGAGSGARAACDITPGYSAAFGGGRAPQVPVDP